MIGVLTWRLERRGVVELKVCFEGVIRAGHVIYSRCCQGDRHSTENAPLDTAAHSSTVAYWILSGSPA